ncbi:MAG: monovalent cation/hydrogen antiporter [Solirubrobacteraceae bacterium]|nr:monovalent cation/hydrogen antiporter [Solirubrobacteraceae bacterium]
MDDLEFLFVLLVAAAGLVRLADLVRVPYPIVLVLGGLGIALIPGLPDLRLPPDVVFLVFLPPLLVAAGYYASPQELRAERTALAHLALVLVLATMAAVAVVAHALVDGLPWAGAFVLGAVVAPTDPVAALATFQRAHAPSRVRLIVEGEALLNDATALVSFRVAVGVATGATFDAAGALGDFAQSVVVGLAVGVAVGWLLVRIVMRLTDRPLTILWTLLGAYSAYIVAEELGGSGVLGAVLAGLYLGWHGSTAFDADVRLSAVAFWEVLEFTLTALIFILLGLQLPALSDNLPVSDVIVPGLAIVGVVMAMRMAAQFVPGVSTADGVRERVVVGWCGMRGAISLAAALSIPLDVQGRDQIIVLTVFVIAVTLVGQGMTLGPLVRALGLRDTRVWSPEEALARLEAAQSALDRLDELETEYDGELPEAVKRLRDLYRARFRMCQEALTGEPGARDEVREARFRYGALRRELIGVERTSLLELRAEGRLRPDTLRLIERELDLEEARIT